MQYLVQNLAFDAVVMIVIDILSITFVICFILKTPKYQIPERSRLQGSSEPGKKDRSGLILTAAVILMSLVSGMTDSILTAFHAEQTCNIYSSVRLFYALGLIAAGWIADIRKRQYLPLATVCAILLSSVSAVFLSDQASYLAGTALTFGLTLIASVKTGKLYQVFLQGSAPGVCLQAAGLYGFCVSRWQDRDRWPLAETVSKASFCIYLTHLFFLEFLAGRGLAAGLLPPVWAVPLLAAAAFGGGFLVWLILRRVPVVKTYLI